MSIFSSKKSDAKSDAKQESTIPGIDLVMEAEPEMPRPPKGGPTPAYGIAEAMQLMRSLPVDQNQELVVRVVRVTLNSLNVRIEDIIEDATRKQKSVQDSIAALHGQVADLERQLEMKRRDIAAQEADFRETTSVKERLLLTEKATSHLPPPPPGATPTSSFSALPPPLPLPRATIPRASTEREESGHAKSS